VGPWAEGLGAADAQSQVFTFRRSQVEFVFDLPIVYGPILADRGGLRVSRAPSLPAEQK
jgi:hypothetical protein